MTQTAEAPDAPAFNLLDEAWVPVNWTGGGSSGVGLRELFSRSREIAGLAESSPPAFVALHRVLLTITHRALTAALGRWTDSDRARWYRDGLPVEAFERYFDTWRERFWLFHPAQPFMQVAALADAPQTRAAKPWTQIALASSSGNNPVVFDHSVDAAPAFVSPGHALLALLGYLQFVPGGPVKVLHGHDRKGPLFDSAVIVPTSETLSRTLVLALHPASTSEDQSQGDRPAWERVPPSIRQLTADATLAEGTNDRYTRLTRAVLLCPSSDGRQVAQLRFAEGIGLLEDGMSTDPMHSYRQTDDKAVRLRFAEGRAAWRDLAALLPTSTGARWRPAAVLSWAQNLLDSSGSFDETLQITVAGMSANQGKLLQTRIERFQLPRGVLSDVDTAVALRGELQRAEDLHNDIKQLATRAAGLAAPNPSHKDARKRARDAVDAGALSSTFFAYAERGLWPLLERLGEGNVEEAHKVWSATLMHAAKTAWSVTGDLLGQSASALRARALTDGHFRRLLRPLQVAAPGMTSTTPEDYPA